MEKLQLSSDLILYTRPRLMLGASATEMRRLLRGLPEIYINKLETQYEGFFTSPLNLDRHTFSVIRSVDGIWDEEDDWGEENVTTYQAKCSCGWHSVDEIEEHESVQYEMLRHYFEVLEAKVLGTFTGPLEHLLRMLEKIQKNTSGHENTSATATN